MLDTHKRRTTAYHPQCNGKVERWHRRMKAAIMAYASEDWVPLLSLRICNYRALLPLILLGLRTAINDDSGVSAAQLTYGTGLRLPSNFFTASEAKIEDAPEFVKDLGRPLRKFESQARRHAAKPVYVLATLKSCSHVFLRADTPRGTLNPPYSGPYSVLERDEKTMVIDCDGEKKKVSLDRIRPTHSMRLSEPPVETPVENKTSLPQRKVRFTGTYSK